MILPSYHQDRPPVREKEGHPDGQKFKQTHIQTSRENVHIQVDRHKDIHERYPDRDRHKCRQTYIKTSRQIKIKTATNTEIKTSTHPDIQTSRHPDINPHIQRDMKMDIQTYRNPDRDIQIDTQTDIKTNIGTDG